MEMREKREQLLRSDQLVTALLFPYFPSFPCFPSFL